MRDTEHVADLGEWVQADPRGGKPLFDQLRSQIIDGIREWPAAAGNTTADGARTGGASWAWRSTPSPARIASWSRPESSKHGALRHFRRAYRSGRRRDGDRRTHLRDGGEGAGHRQGRGAQVRRGGVRS